MVDLSPTRVSKKRGATRENAKHLKEVTVGDRSQATKSLPAAIRHPNGKHIRRTAEEIALGLSKEEALATRLNKSGHGIEVATVTGKIVEIKAKRFRRTREEIALGLSMEDAAARRGKTVATKTYAERPAPAPAPSLDLIETLGPRVQVRARAVSRYRSNGGKGLITADMLDQIERSVAAGKVTKCPPFIDSDGYNHRTGEEAK